MTLDALSDATTTTLRANLENESWQSILTTKICPRYAKDMQKYAQDMPGGKQFLSQSSYQVIKLWSHQVIILSSHLHIILSLKDCAKLTAIPPGSFYIEWKGAGQVIPLKITKRCKDEAIFLANIVLRYFQNSWEHWFDQIRMIGTTPYNTR